MGRGDQGRIVLISILLIGIFLRFYGINFGLPFLYDPDEGVYVTSAIHMLRNHDPNPHWFGAPASTTIYMMAIITAIHYASGKVFGIYDSPNDFRDSYDANPGIVYLPGRILCALFGIASIYLVYLITRRVVNVPTALISSAFLALSPLHVEFSKLIRMDIQLGFLLLVAFWYCLNILDRQDLKSYLIAGFFIGLACVTKYYGVVFTLVLILAHFFSNGWTTKNIKRLIGSFFMIIAGAFIGSPYLFWSYQKVLRDLRYEAVTVYVGVPTGGVLENIGWFISRASVDSLGLIGLLLTGAGSVIWIAKKPKEGVLFATFPVALIVFLSFLGVRWERWILPAVPFMCILAGYAIDSIVDYFRRWSPRLPTPAMIVLVLATALPILYSSYVQGREMSGSHTRTQAYDWVVATIPSGSKILGEIYTPQLVVAEYDVFYVAHNGELKQAGKKTSAHYRIGGNLGKIRNIDDIKKAGIQYFIMSHMYSRYLLERNKFPQIIRTYETLMSNATLLHEIRRQPGRNRGPQLRIYRFNWSASQKHGS